LFSHPQEKKMPVLTKEEFDDLNWTKENYAGMVNQIGTLRA